jgi:hypothetical protein
MARVQHDSDTGTDTVVERFHATSGQVSGWLTVVLAGALALVGLLYLDDGFPPWVAAAGLLVAVLAWAAMLRPALWVTREHLVMRNLAETVHIRLAAIEEMALRQVLAVRADDRRWVSTVVGRSWRKAVTSRRTPSGEATPLDGMPYADFVESRLHDLVDTARTAAGVRPGSPEQLALPGAVRRQPARLPLALIAAATLVLVAALIV